MTNLRRSTIGLLSVVTVLVLAACGQQTTPPGSLTITVAGLGAGVNPFVSVTGPGGYSNQVLVGTTATLTGLLPGQYVVDGLAIEIASTTSEGVEVFDAPPEAVTVSSGAAASADVQYQYSGLHIMDPANDAVAILPTPDQYVYDIVRLWTAIDGSNLVITMEHRADQTDLSESIGELYFDIDQNDATGTPSSVDMFCTEGSNIGAEFVLWISEVGEASWIDTYPDYGFVAEIERVDVGSTSTFAVPLSAIGGSARVDIELVVGNFDEPTDCLSRGIATSTF